MKQLLSSLVACIFLWSCNPQESFQVKNTKAFEWVAGTERGGHGTNFEISLLAINDLENLEWGNMYYKQFEIPIDAPSIETMEKDEELLLKVKYYSNKHKPTSNVSGYLSEEIPAAITFYLNGELQVLPITSIDYQPLESRP